MIEDQDKLMEAFKKSGHLDFLLSLSNQFTVNDIEKLEDWTNSLR